MMLAPGTMAVHGSSYDARGIAYLTTGTCTPPVDWVGPICQPQDNTPIYNADVLWTGYNPPGGLPFNSYHVTITDVTTGAILTQKLFTGMEQWGCCVVSNYEFFAYHGCSAAVAWSPQCVEIPNFDIYGLQSISVSTAQQAMLYEGWMDQYALVLVVDNYL